MLFARPSEGSADLDAEIPGVGDHEDDVTASHETVANATHTSSRVNLTG